MGYAMSTGVERFVLYNPEQKIYHCGAFLDPDQGRAFLYASQQFARQGLMKSWDNVGDKKTWVIQRVLVDWDQFGDLIGMTVVEEIPF
jgi:hypothetical protein